MKTETVIKSFNPASPLALPKNVFRRLLASVLVAGLTVFVVWASMGTMAQPAPTPGATDWQRYQTATFAFSYPAGWTVHPAAEGGGGTYRLAPSEQDEGTHVTIALVPHPTTTLAQVERMGVAHVERNEAVTRHFLRILPRTRLADRVAARVRYTADLDSGERIEGLWIGLPRPDGQVLTLILDVYPDASYNAAHHTFKRLLASVTLEG